MANPQLVLTWGSYPEDLDAKVIFFDSDGRWICFLYFDNKNCEDYANLDVDRKMV